MKKIKFFTVVFVLFLCSFLVIQEQSLASKTIWADGKTTTSVITSYNGFPLYFIQNQGQIDEKVKFYEKGASHSTFFTSEGVYLLLIKSQPVTSSINYKSAGKKMSVLGLNPVIAGNQQEHDNLKDKIIQQHELIKLIPIGGNKHPEITAEGLLKGKVNYLKGRDPEKWKTNIPTYQAVVYKEIYKGIDIRFYGNNQHLEYDIIVKPGADPSVLRFSYEGIDSLKIMDNGDLEIGLKQDKLLQKRPYIYQEINGKRVEVAGKFKVKS